MYYNTLTNTLHSEAALVKLGLSPNLPDYIVKLTNNKPVKDTALYLVTETGYDLVASTITYEVKTRNLLSVLPTLKDRLKVKRNEVEQGGIVITGTGTKFDSTRVDGQMLHNAYVGVKNFMPEAIVDYITATGWVTVTVEVLEQLFAFYSTHVELCFSREKQISDLLDAAETSDEAIEIFNTEINNGWPTYAE